MAVHQEDIRIVQIYAPNIRVPKHTKQILTSERKNGQYNNRGLHYPSSSNE